MATTPSRTASDYMAELQLKLKNNLTEVEFEAYKSALGLSIKGQSDLSKERARRGTKITEAIANYERALNSPIPAARARALVDLRKMELELPIKFAAAAYAPNNALLSVVNQAVPPDLMRTDTSRQAAKKAWQTFFLDPRSRDGNMLGSYRVMVENYGVPNADYYGPNEGPVAEAAQSFFAAQKTAEANAANFDAQMNTARRVTDNWNKFLADTGLDPEADETMQTFLNARPDLTKMLPTESAPFIGQLRQMVQNPKENKAFFSDIDAQIQSFAEKEDEYRGYLKQGSGEEAASAQTEREKIAGWIQRSDVQAWAKKWGLNLGTVQPVTPEIQKLIDDGQISKDMLVNGKLYTPAPDDERAVNLAFRQLQRDPQKNVLYNMGLLRDDTKSVIEVEEIVKPAGPPPKGVEARKAVGKNGKEQFVFKLEDGSYAAGPAEPGAAYTRLPAESGERIFESAEPMASGKFPEPAVVNGIENTPAETRTRRLQYFKPQYGTDRPGAVRGIDLDTGKMVVVQPEKIQSQTFIGDDPSRKSAAQFLRERRAARTKKREDIDVTDAATNEMDIGPRASGKQIKESNTEYREAAEGAMEDAAERADAKAAAAQPAPAAKAPVTDSLLKRMFGNAPEPKTQAEREAAMQTTYTDKPKPEVPRKQGLPVNPPGRDGYTGPVDENLNRVPPSSEADKLATKRANAASPGEAVGANVVDMRRKALDAAVDNAKLNRGLAQAATWNKEQEMFDAALTEAQKNKRASPPAPTAPTPPPAPPAPEASYRPSSAERPMNAPPVQPAVKDPTKVQKTDSARTAYDRRNKRASPTVMDTGEEAISAPAR